MSSTPSSKGVAHGATPPSDATGSKAANHPAAASKAALQKTEAEKTPRKSSAKSGRSRSREFALQGLYQFLVGRNDAADIDVFTRDLSGFHKSDSVHYDALLYGCIENCQVLDALIVPLLDRKLEEISPIEHAVMWMGAYEFQHCIDVPWRVVLNEYIELAKSFGGTDGHKYVNAVLNGLAPQLRAAEVQADRNNHGNASSSGNTRSIGNGKTK